MGWNTGSTQGDHRNAQPGEGTAAFGLSAMYRSNARQRLPPALSPEIVIWLAGTFSSSIKYRNDVMASWS